MASQEGTSQDQMVDQGIDTRLQTHTIDETLARIKECSAFYKLVQDAGLGYLLRRSGLHTLLAPGDDALGSISTANAERFLNRHLFPGGMESFDLRQCDTVKTVEGISYPVQHEDGRLRIGPAAIVRSDIACTNGFIHIVDASLAG